MRSSLKISIFFFMLFFTLNSTSNATSEKFITKKPMTVEEAYEAMGYTDFKEAKKEFEKEFNSRINLPQKIPFKVEYKYGKVDEKNSMVTFEYLGENFKGNQLNVIISSNTEHKLEGENDNYTLKNGTKVYIRENPNLNQHTTLSFEKDNLKYYLNLFYQDKDKQKKKLIEIANSLDL